MCATGGRDAVADLIGAARPLADVLWMRETETGAFDTPERRAALEARVGEVTGAIGDETVRRYYRQDFRQRLRNLLEPARPPLRAVPVGRQPWTPRTAGERGERGKFQRRSAPPALMGGMPYVVASPQLATSPVHRGHRAVLPRREALILQVVLNHPWLLHDHLEDLSSIEFPHADAEAVKAALIDICAHEAAPDGEALRSELARRGLAEQVGRVEKAITTTSVWGALAEAGPEDVLMTWNQLIALHRQHHSLLRELKDAEQALGREPTEANYSWLQDVKARLSVLDGTEALIEGFGAASGRKAQGL